LGNACYHGVKNHDVTGCSLWASNVISYVKGITQGEDVAEQGELKEYLNLSTELLNYPNYFYFHLWENKK
jgi:hypothetical protein